MIESFAAWIDRWWDRLAGQPSAPDDPSFPWRRHILTAFAIVGYAGLDAARRGLDGALSKLHPVDSPAFGANDLHDGRREANRALAAWEEGTEEFRAFLRWTGRHIAVVQTLVELALVFFTAALLYSLVRFLRNELTRVRTEADTTGEPMPFRSGPHELVLCVCTIAVVVYFVLGVVNQLLELTILARNQGDAAVTLPLQVGHYLRWICLRLTLLPAAITAFVLARNVWHPFQRLARAGSAYRVLGALAGLHFLLLVMSVPAEQSRDAIRLWSYHEGLAVWGVAATACFSLALAALGLRLSTLRHAGGEIVGRRGTVRVIAIGTAVALVGWILHTWANWGNGVTAIGLVVLAVGALSAPIIFFAHDARRGRRLVPPSPQTQVVVPAVLALLPLVALEMAIVNAGTPELVMPDRPWWLLFVAAIVAVLGVVGYVAARRVGELAYRAARDNTAEPFRRGAFVAVVGGLLVASVVVATVVIVDPWDADVIGVHGLLGAFLIVVTTVIGLVGYLVEGRPLPAALDFVGLRRLPLVTALLVWALVAAVLTDEPFHEIRVMAASSERATPVTVADAFDRWVATNAPDATVVPATPGADRTVPGVPLVFVTAAGGGLRAATFTSFAIECVFSTVDPEACRADDGYAEADAWSNVFVASGASGGSVGIASVVATRAAGTTNESWVAERLGTDLLSPELAWQLFVEAPNAFVGFNPGRDRAEVLERTWERQFGGDGGLAAQPFFGEFSSEGWPGPLLFLNGTNLSDGCRVTISPARSTAGGGVDTPAAPGATARDDCRRRRIDGPADTLDQIVARDLTDYLCADEDIRLSTAAFLSARFPFVAPTGIVRDLDERRDDCPTASTTGQLSIGDGGYRDNTGAAAVADVWSELEPTVLEFNRTHDTCIVPVLLEIDNGHQGRGGPATADPAFQLIAPATGILNVVSSRDAGPIEAIAAEFSRALDPTMTVSVNGDAAAARFARLTLYDHPGVLAPLGWSLSDAAVEDLQGQLDAVPENRNTIETVGSWLTPAALTCTIPAVG